MPRVHALALQQVGDQPLHLPDVAEQIVLHLAVLEELQGHLGAGERRAQFVADGEQQLLLRLEHVLDVVRHAIDVGGQVAEIVAARGPDPVVQVALADARRALLDPLDGLDQPAHGEVAADEHDDGDQGDRRLGVGRPGASPTCAATR